MILKLCRLSLTSLASLRRGGQKAQIRGFLPNLSNPKVDGSILVFTLLGCEEPADKLTSRWWTTGYADENNSLITLKAYVFTEKD